MAHELGHFVLHRDRLNEGTSDGIAFRTVPGNGLDNPQIGQVQEAQANAFAAEILMPVHLVASAMESAGNDVKVAAKKLQTSEAALKIRLEALRRSGKLT
jgi:Zn-dependent peptidase ImmA (M78 family)